MKSDCLTSHLVFGRDLKISSCRPSAQEKRRSPAGIAFEGGAQPELLRLQEPYFINLGNLVDWTMECDYGEYA